jgi:hypothetical protein
LSRMIIVVNAVVGFGFTPDLETAVVGSGFSRTVKLPSWSPALAGP